MTYINNLSIKAILAIIVGALLTLSFAPFYIWPMALIIPAAFYWLLHHESLKRSLFIGWLFGVGFFGTSISWVYVSISTYGPPNAIIAFLITLLFIFAMALLFLVLAGALTGLYPHESVNKCFFAYPAIWVIFEIIRSKLFTGFPWVLLGESQTSFPLGGYTPVFGVYFTSLICILISSFLFYLFYESKLKLQIINVIGIIALILIGYGLYQINWTKIAVDDAGEPKSANIVLVQGNIPEYEKWDQNKQEYILKTYLNLSKPALTNTNQLIFWPESAIPVFEQQAKPFLDQVSKIASSNYNAVLTGIPIYKDNKYYNGAVVLGVGEGEYLKQHLVPFGEYLPLPHYLSGVINYFKIPMSDFSAGPANQPLIKMDGAKIRLFNCFESAFPQLVANQLDNADFIATISDDSWFGNSLGPKQHEQIRQTRALETGRYLVSATNNGVTSVINPKGVVIKELPAFTRGVLYEKIDIFQGITPWVHYEMMPIYLILLIFILITLIFNQKINISEK